MFLFGYLSYLIVFRQQLRLLLVFRLRQLVSERPLEQIRSQRWSFVKFLC